MLPKDKLENLLKADIYRILSKGFSYPEEQNIIEMQSIIEEILISPYLDTDTSIHLKEILTAVDTQDIKALQQEYSRLFIKGTIPICESHYHPRVDGKSISDVSGFYLAFGLKPKSGEAPDSLAYELEFMSLLILKAAMAQNQEQLEITSNAYKKFLHEHLADFIEKFTGKMHAAMPIPFYQNYSKFLQHWITKEIMRSA